MKKMSLVFLVVLLAGCVSLSGGWRGLYPIPSSSIQKLYVGMTEYDMMEFMPPPASRNVSANGSEMRVQLVFRVARPTKYFNFKPVYVYLINGRVVSWQY